MYINIDTQEIAEKIYSKCSDMDLQDYAEEKEKEIAEIENALYHIKCYAQNEYNQEYWRTLLNALDRMI